MCIRDSPNSIEGEEAEILLEEVIPIVENANFKQVEKGNNFKLIYYFPKENYKKTLVEAKNFLNGNSKEIKNNLIEKITKTKDESEKTSKKKSSKKADSTKE